MPDACREIALTGADEPMLACLNRHGSAVDDAMGISGPLLFHFELEVLAVHQKKLTTLLKSPFAIGGSGAFYSDPASMYFSASLSVSGDAIDIIAAPAECAKALADLPAFFEKRKAGFRTRVPDPASRAMLVRATGAEEKQTAQELGAICKTSGHYTIRHGGKLSAKRWADAPVVPRYFTRSTAAGPTRGPRSSIRSTLVRPATWTKDAVQAGGRAVGRRDRLRHAVAVTGSRP